MWRMPNLFPQAWALAYATVIHLFTPASYMFSFWCPVNCDSPCLNPNSMGPPGQRYFLFSCLCLNQWLDLVWNILTIYLFLHSQVNQQVLLTLHLKCVCLSSFYAPSPCTLTWIKASTAPTLDEYSNLLTTSSLHIGVVGSILSWPTNDPHPSLTPSYGLRKEPMNMICHLQVTDSL